MSNLDQYTVEELDRENKELKASNRALLNHLVICHNEQPDEYIGMGAVQNLINSTPSQSLADIKADAVRDYEASLSSFPWTAEEYIEKMIRGKS